MSKTTRTTKAKDTAPSEPNEDVKTSSQLIEDEIFEKPEGSVPIQKHHLSMGKIVKYELLELKQTQEGFHLFTRHYEGESADQKIKFGIGGQKLNDILDKIQAKGYIIPPEQSPTEQKQIIIFLPFQDGTKDIYWLYQTPY